MNWDHESDVVIVDGGGAGLGAAVEASGARAATLLIEACPQLSKKSIFMARKFSISAVGAGDARRSGAGSGGRDSRAGWLLRQLLLRPYRETIRCIRGSRRI